MAAVAEKALGGGRGGGEGGWGWGGGRGRGGEPAAAAVALVFHVRDDACKKRMSHAGAAVRRRFHCAKRTTLARGN